VQLRPFVNQFAETRELSRVALVEARLHRREGAFHLRIDFLEQLQSIAGDARDGMSPVLRAAIALDEMFFRKAIDDAGDVGRARPRPR